MIRLIFLMFAIVAAAPAAAQESDYGARQRSLVSLAQIFGEIHHIRRTCDPDREADVWRNRMKRLIDLEEPSFDVREQMVGAFNGGYVSAQARFPYCDRGAEDYAAARAYAGEALVSNLTAPLYADERNEDAANVTVFRGNE
ncbi:MAG TPA: TIGR02301 family protein [Parvularcula sp.]|nr:TIGR02301 family protein [Parvularcula sp.]HBS32335.1 TIGR02301 family protein [Parvularcula sp.]HBS36196.1 TIGR02301 family protein [Parvularcula sp.]